MAPLDFGCKGVAGSLTHAAQRLCCHRALHPEDETIMKLTRIIDASIIDAPRLSQRTQIAQMMPVAMVPGQP
jgi:hypothetical protein